MADEPLSKKRRTTENEEESPREEREVRHERSITLDLSTYPDWVRKLSDEELAKIFALGVLAKESLTMTVDSNQELLEKVLASQLDSQMKPVQRKVQEIEETMSKSVSDNMLSMTKAATQSMQNISTEIGKFKSDLVSAVVNKDKSGETLATEVSELKKAVKDLGKPQTKGSRGEQQVLEILKEGLPKNFTVEHSAAFGSSGDVLITTPEEEQFLIEVKNHSNTVPKESIENFENVVVNFAKAKVGIMLSLKSGIARRAKRGRFEIFSDKNKQFIYVPNAMEDQNLMVWSVMLANELTQLNAELKDDQKSKLSSLYENFKKSIDNAKRSRRNLESLETTVKSLRENIEPILDIVEKCKNEIYKLLHS